MESEVKEKENPEAKNLSKLQPCVRCGYMMSLVKGSKKAICKNCGYKDDCC